MLPVLPVRLDRTLADPLGVQLSAQVRGLVLDGTLHAGDRLPSSRALAADLRVSRSVTEQAYDQLVAEGWVEARRGAGTFVASSAVGAQPPGRRSAPRPRTPSAPPVRLDAGTPWIDPRHAAGWRRAWREVSTATPPRGYDDPRGLPELRAALAERLGRTRGVRCDADEVVVTAGTTDGLRHLLGAVRPGPVGFEDPGYRAAVETARALGREVRDLPAADPVVGLGGPGVSTGWRRRTSPRPTSTRWGTCCRRPTGCGCSRRRGGPTPWSSRTTTTRSSATTSRRCPPSPRSTATTSPTSARRRSRSRRACGWGGWSRRPRCSAPIEARRAVTHDAASWPVQRAFLALLRDGYLDQVVRSARRVYAERAPRVAAALSPYARAAGPSAGMYSTWLLPQARAVAARDAALAEGFEVNLLSDYCRSAPLTGLVVGFGGVTDRELDQALAALVRALAADPGPGLGARPGPGPGPGPGNCLANGPVPSREQGHFGTIARPRPATAPATARRRPGARGGGQVRSGSLSGPDSARAA